MQIVRVEPTGSDNLLRRTSAGRMSVLLRTSKPIAGEIVSKRGEIENGKP
jgi:hypothetical protein